MILNCQYPLLNPISNQTHNTSTPKILESLEHASAVSVFTLFFNSLFRCRYLRASNVFFSLLRQYAASFK
eukprot:m.45950 g.45950  ORF g.45950 m.45950 type:complete len:70 (+) comp10309_c0_seq4:1435-1644(+)